MYFIGLLLIPKLVSSAIDCNDGNRGGCSHTCYQNECKCPPCWELDASELDCVPAQNKVKITCSSSGMAVLVDQCVFPGDRTLSLRDSFCVGRQDPDGAFLFSTMLEQCDTQLKIDVDAQKATFRNSVIGQPRRHKGVIFGRRLSFDFQCTYDMNYTDVASDQQIDAKSYRAETFSSGDLDYTINFYHDNDFSIPVSKNSTQRIGSRIFYEVAATKPLEKLSFYVSECRVVEIGTKNIYKIIEKNCLNKPLQMQIHSEFVSQTSIRLSYKAFAFADSSSDLISQKIECTVNVCTPDFSCPTLQDFKCY